MSDDFDINSDRRVAKIYFTGGFESLVKDMAASIRNQKSHAHLIDQKHFRNADNVLPCHAVLIQATARNARLIGRTYQQDGVAGCEVVFFDDNGKITKLDLVEPTTSFATMLGGTDEKPTENDAEQQVNGLLGQPEGRPDGGTAGETAGPADITDGNSAENADNSES